MSFIKFESSWDKEKARQHLREARDEMLEKAKRNAELRAEREAGKELRGEKNWMLPSLAVKFEKPNKKPKHSKKKQKKHQKKKSKKNTKKKRKRYSSSSSDSSSDTESDSESSSSDSSSEDEQRSRKKSKRKKEKRYSSSENDHGDINEKKSKSKVPSEEEQERIEPCESLPKIPLERDSWMTEGSFVLKTFAKDRVENKPSEKQHYETYDPSKSSRELNPYWKATGTGLPSFKKPGEDSDEERTTSFATKSNNPTSFRSWQKKIPPSKSIETQKLKKPRASSTSSSSSSASEEEKNEPKIPQKEDQIETNKFLTDQQMNELSAKILKAEIMGNTQLVQDLKKKLEEARCVRTELKTAKVAKLQANNDAEKQRKSFKSSNKEAEHVLLTHTDQQGNIRPLAQRKPVVDPRDLYGGRKGQKKQKSKRMETHVDGERVRYFPDDDKYDIKQMFEREKYSSAADSNMQFANIASKHKNPNDDLEDIFADKVRKNISEEHSDRKDMQRAIKEHKKLSQQLDNCDKCFESTKMDKQLMVAMGNNVYLSLPWYVGLQNGTCLIIPTQHVSCCTQLDEDSWTEMNDFRKAITRMFAAQRKDVIFFEIANKLHRKPHTSIHCIPIPQSKGEMAPFYFKKAIEESEYEWCVNKQLISLTKKSLRSCIPKGLPYFWVHFGMDTGFAHVIEDEERFPNNFAMEIIGGMLQLDVNKWRKLKKEQNPITKVKQFADWWKKYDCTSNC